MTKPTRNTAYETQDSSRLLSLDDVLEAYSMTDEGPSLRALPRWTARYPQYAAELVEFTAQWALAQHLPDVIDVDETDQETLVLRGMSIIQEAMFAAKQQQQQIAPVPQPVVNHPAEPVVTTPSVPTSESDPSTRPLRGLLIEGQRLGFDPDTLAERLGIFSGSLLTKLDRCLIEYATIPASTINTMAITFHRQTSAICEYLSGQPNFSFAMQHRANQPPSLPTTKISFYDAVKQDPELTEEQRNQLTALV